MTYSDKLRKLLNQYGGTITAKEAIEAGISKEMLRLLANVGEVERVAHGVYITGSVS